MERPADSRFSLPTDSTSSASVAVFQKVLGSARSAYSLGDLTVCFWDARRMDEYDLPATKELVINLHTGGAPVRTRLRSGWTRAMAPGHVHVMPPSVPTTWKAGEELTFVSVHFPMSRIEEVAEDRIQARRWLGDLRFRAGVQDPLIAAAVSALAQNVREPGERATLFADHLADTILLQVLRTRLESDADSPSDLRGGLPPGAVRRLRERIRETLAIGATVGDLAREVGLSRAHFARAFRISMGVPPHRYVLECRVARAKELLATTDQSLLEIALSVGFSSQSHFTETFRQLTGCTPRRFRRRVDGDIGR